MNRVNELILMNGMQQKEVAYAVGVSRPTVSEWVHQKKDPTGKRLLKLAELFNVSTGVILGLESLQGVPNSPADLDIQSGITDLTESEKKLIRRFRELDEDDQEAVLYRALELVKARDADVQREKNQAV